VTYRTAPVKTSISSPKSTSTPVGIVTDTSPSGVETSFGCTTTT
jgi:hypothetical protein